MISVSQGVLGQDNFAGAVLNQRRESFADCPELGPFGSIPIKVNTSAPVGPAVLVGEGNEVTNTHLVGRYKLNRTDSIDTDNYGVAVVSDAGSNDYNVRRNFHSGISSCFGFFEVAPNLYLIQLTLIRMVSAHLQQFRMCGVVAC